MRKLRSRQFGARLRPPSRGARAPPQRRREGGTENEAYRGRAGVSSVCGAPRATRRGCSISRATASACDSSASTPTPAVTSWPRRSRSARTKSSVLPEEYTGVFGLRDARELSSAATSRDDLGGVTSATSSSHRDVPVFAGVLRTHLNAPAADRRQRRVVPDLNLDVAPAGRDRRLRRRSRGQRRHRTPRDLRARRSPHDLPVPVSRTQPARIATTSSGRSRSATKRTSVSSSTSTRARARSSTSCAGLYDA